MISCSRLLFLQQRRWSAWWKVAANKCVRIVSPVFTSFNLCKCVMPYCCRTVFYVQESEGSSLHWVSLEAPVINSGNCTWESQTCLFAWQQNATGYKGILETTGWEMMPDNTSPSGHILGEFFAYLTCDGPPKIYAYHSLKKGWEAEPSSATSLSKSKDDFHSKVCTY